jgi:hypothetical protein
MTEIETLYGYLITKKDFQINTVEDITKNTLMVKYGFTMIWVFFVVLMVY